MGFTFFKKKEKKEAVERAELKQELYPELPELPELKEPEPLPLAPIKAESIREAVEKEPQRGFEQPIPEPLKFELGAEPKEIIPAEKPFTEEPVEEEKPLESFERPKLTPAFLTKPVFIEGADFRRIYADLNRITKKPAKLKKLAKEEEKMLEEWHENLEGIQRKLVLMDRTIFGG